MADVGSKQVGAVANAVRLLRALAEAEGPLGVTAAARAAGVSPSTALLILRTLSDEGIVAFDPRHKTYAPGFGLLPLARGLLGRSELDLIRPELVRLATAHECLVALWRVEGDRVILVDRALATTPVRLDMEITRRMPAFIGAIGKAYAAHSDLSREELRKRFERLRWQGPMDFARYVSEVDEARAKGYALDRECLYRGIEVVAAVVPRAGGPPRIGVSAIVLAGQTDASGLAAIGTELARVCKAVGDPPGARARETPPAIAKTAG